MVADLLLQSMRKSDDFAGGKIEGRVAKQPTKGKFSKSLHCTRILFDSGQPARLAGRPVLGSQAGRPVSVNLVALAGWLGIYHKDVD